MMRLENKNLYTESLEYPPLYWIARHSPRLQSFLHYFYRIRWTISSLLSTRCCLFHCWYGTIGQILIYTLFFVLFVLGLLSNVLHRDANESGRYCNAFLIVSMITCNQNSFVTLVLGIPLQNLLLYHKLAGDCMVLFALFHCITAYRQFLENNNGQEETFCRFSFRNRFNTSGTIMFLSICLLTLTSFRILRHFCLQVFYHLHIGVSLILVVSSLFHPDSTIFIVFCVFCGIDMFIRYLLMSTCKYPTKAHIIKLSDTIFEVSFPKHTYFHYNPGQYLSLAIPKLQHSKLTTPLQYHPFYIASSPYQDTVTLYITPNGNNWTNQNIQQHCNHGISQDVSIQGPIGSYQIDLFHQTKYKLILLISSDTGVSYCQSICDQLVYESECEGRELKKIWFVWTTSSKERPPKRKHAPKNDPKAKRSFGAANGSSFRSADDSYRIEDYVVDDVEPEEEEEMHPVMPVTRPSTRNLLRSSLAMSILSQYPCATAATTTAEKEEEDETENLGIDPSDTTFGELSSPLLPTDTDESKQPSSSTLEGIWDYEIQDGEDDELLEIELYATESQMQHGMQRIATNNDASMNIRPFTKSIREWNIDELVRRRREDAKKLGERRVAVLVCGNRRLVKQCERACWEFSSKGGGVTFDLHTEILEL